MDTLVNFGPKLLLLYRDDGADAIFLSGGRIRPLVAIFYFLSRYRVLLLTLKRHIKQNTSHKYSIPTSGKTANLALDWMVVVHDGRLPALQ